MSSLLTAATMHKLRTAVLLLFGDQQGRSGVVPDVASAGSPEEQQVWQQPLARWCLAALLNHYCTCAAGVTISGGAPSSSGTEWQQQEARQLAQQFAASSYGDRLFGAAVALLLQRAVPLTVQVSRLSTCCIELLQFASGWLTCGCTWQQQHLCPCVLPCPADAVSAAGGAFNFGRRAGIAPATTIASASGLSHHICGCAHRLRHREQFWRRLLWCWSQHIH